MQPPSVVSFLLSPIGLGSIYARNPFVFDAIVRSPSNWRANNEAAEMVNAFRSVLLQTAASVNQSTWADSSAHYDVWLTHRSAFAEWTAASAEEVLQVAPFTTVVASHASLGGEGTVHAVNATAAEL